jgi:hypothetical protein
MERLHWDKKKAPEILQKLDWPKCQHNRNLKLDIHM